MGEKPLVSGFRGFEWKEKKQNEVSCAVSARAYSKIWIILESLAVKVRSTASRRITNQSVEYRLIFEKKESSISVTHYPRTDW